MSIQVTKEQTNIREQITMLQGESDINSIIYKLGNYDGPITLRDNVGIGTTNPEARLEVYGVGGNGTGYNGDPVLKLQAHVDNNFTHTLNSYAPNITTGHRNVMFVGRSDDDRDSCSVGFKAGATNDQNTMVFGFWNYNDRMSLDSGGDLALLGTVTESTSDIRLKENIVDATPKLPDLMKLKVKNFNLIDDDNKIKRIGFIAQELEQVFPSLVKTIDTRQFDDNGQLISGLEDAKTVRVTKDFAILTKAIQEQQAMIDDLKQQIEQLKAQ
jgi:hypothetical protein